MNSEVVPVRCGYCLQLLGEHLESHLCFSNYVQLQLDDNGFLFGADDCSGATNINSPLEFEAAGSTDMVFSSKRSDWADKEVCALIDAYKEHERKFSSPMYNKKNVWEIISQELIKLNIRKTGPKCDEKWRNLKKNFDRACSENKMTGNSHHKYKFFDQLQEVFAKSPQFYPVATASSSGKTTLQDQPLNLEGKKRKIDKPLTSESNSPMSSRTSSISDITNSPSGSTTPNSSRKSMPVSNRRMTLREYDANKERRHQERLKQKEEALSWFKELMVKKRDE